MQDEEWNEASVSIRERGGNKFVSRMFDDPTETGISLTISDYELSHLKLISVHRGKVIYVAEGTSEWKEASVRDMDERVIIVNLPHEEEGHPHCSLYAQDSSPFIYISDCEILYVLHSETREFLPILRTREVFIHYIVGVHEGELTCVGLMNDE
ncbi:hypothetical protein PMAYCL1PPCAC_28820, partial [Pristionchus mayeri]